MDENTLRQVLRMPLHNLLNGGSHNSYAFVETSVPDVEDTDYGNFSVLLQQLLAAFSSKSWLALPQELSPPLDFAMSTDLKYL